MATTNTPARRTAKRKSKAPTGTGELTVGMKMKMLRRAARSGTDGFP